MKSIRFLIFLGMLVIFPGSGSAQETPFKSVLHGFIETALKNNPAIKEFQHRIKAVEEVSSQVSSLDDPILEFQLKNMPVDTFDLSQESATQKQFTRSQKLPYPGKLGLKAEIAGKNITITRQDLEEARLTITRDVKLAFYELCFVLAATSISMKPKSEWREGMTPKKLIEEMDAALKIPGVTNIWTMSIKNRIDMLSTGIKTPVGIKISGNDLNVLEKLRKEVETLIKNVPGTMSVFSERVVGGNYFDFEINRDEAARYGLTVGDIQDVIQTAIGGMNVSTIVQGLERYPINVRYPRGLRDDWDELRRVLIPKPGGGHIPMAQVAKISIKKGPPVIKTENARLNAWVYIDLKDMDIGTYVENAKRILGEKLTLLPGYFLIWSGQYEYMERAKERLKLVVPMTLVIIFVLLYLNFQRMSETIIVMLSLPLALIGGVWMLYYLQYELSVAVAVGFIALAGVAAEIGVLILVYCNQVFENRLANGEIQNNRDVLKAVFDGTSSRIRPIMMTVISTTRGLIPIMIGTGTGSEVMKRIAAPMVGGMVSATLLNLIVLPALYAMVLQFRFSRRRPVIESADNYSEKRTLTSAH